MITFDRVSKVYRTKTTTKTVLDNVSVVFPTGRNIGILGLNGSGKSTMLRMVAGSEMPDRGKILKDCRVSFPVAFAGTVHPNMTGRENVVFIARVYGENPKTVMDYVADFSDLGAYFDMPTRTYSSGMMAKLAFGLCLAIDFDLYLVDEVTAVGDAPFQARCKAVFEERMRYSNVMIVSHSFETIRSYCQTGAILWNGDLRYFDNIETAIMEYRNLIGTTKYTVAQITG